LVVEGTRFIADEPRFVAEGARRVGDKERFVVDGARWLGHEVRSLDDGSLEIHVPSGSLTLMGDRTAGAKAAQGLLASDERLRKKIFVYAYSLTRDVGDAKDLAQEGMAKVVDPQASPWAPDVQPDLFMHVGSVMNSIAANRRRADTRHPTETYDKRSHERADPAPNAEEILVDTETRAEVDARLKRWVDELRRRLAGHPVALGKIELLYEGVDGTAEQAARLGCTVKDVYGANERIAYHVAQMRKAGRGHPSNALRASRPEAPPDAQSQDES
jgi:DNA-directed RNA polymerase specialized sigma24 family protein